MASSEKKTASSIALAKEALRIGDEALDEFSARRSRHDFTQPQLFAVLVMRQFFRTDYRRMSQMLADYRELREALGLTKVPHFTTLQKAEQRLLKKGLSSGCRRLFSRARKLSESSAKG